MVTYYINNNGDYFSHGYGNGGYYHNQQYGYRGRALYIKYGNDNGCQNKNFSV